MPCVHRTRQRVIPIRKTNNSLQCRLSELLLSQLLLEREQVLLQLLNLAPDSLCASRGVRQAYTQAGITKKRPYLNLKTDLALILCLLRSKLAHADELRKGRVRASTQEAGCLFALCLACGRSSHVQQTA